MNIKNKMLRLFEVYQIPQYEDYELHYNDDEQLVYSKKRGKYLKNYLNHCGYYFVNLYNSEGIKTWCLHRIVWVCFNGDIPTDMQVNHINECKTDNSISNLNLMTPKENTEYSQAISIVGINKTTYDIIEFPSAHEAERTDKRFNHGSISKCCKHKRYKTVNEYYFFYKDEFDELLNKYNGVIKNIIEYKISKYG